MPEQLLTAAKTRGWAPWTQWRKALLRMLVGGGLAIVATGTQAEPAANDLNALLGAYQCTVFDAIEAIHRIKHPGYEQNRYLVLVVMDKPQAFVQTYAQCHFEDGDRSFDCEVASGYWEDIVRKPADHMPPSSIAYLGSLGFNTNDSHANFQREMPAKTQEQRAEVAELLLRAMYGVFNARANSRIDIEAPELFRGQRRLKPHPCQSIS